MNCLTVSALSARMISLHSIASNGPALRNDDPRFPEIELFRVGRPHFDREIEDTVAGSARLPDQLGQASAEAAAATHVLPLEVHARALRHAVIHPNLGKGLIRWHEAGYCNIAAEETGRESPPTAAARTPVRQSGSLFKSSYVAASNSCVAPRNTPSPRQRIEPSCSMRVIVPGPSSESLSI